VDPPYGKAPTAQLAEKLPEKGRAGEVFDTTREMLLETQVGDGQGVHVQRGGAAGRGSQEGGGVMGTRGVVEVFDTTREMLLVTQVCHHFAS
jgi:hypothetical protein